MAASGGQHGFAARLPSIESMIKRGYLWRSSCYAFWHGLVDTLSTAFQEAIGTGAASVSRMSELSAAWRFSGALTPTASTQCEQSAVAMPTM